MYLKLGEYPEMLGPRMDAMAMGWEEGMVRLADCACDEEAGSWIAGDVNGVSEWDGGCTVDGERKEASVILKSGLNDYNRLVVEYSVGTSGIMS